MIDASKSIEDLHTELKIVVKDIINKSKTQDLGQLWTKTESERPIKKRCADESEKTQKSATENQPSPTTCDR